MVYQKFSLVKFSALLLATAAVCQWAGERPLRSMALAQTADNGSSAFTVPSSLPQDAALNVDGSTSMDIPNQDLRARFLERFPDTPVEVMSSRSDEAIKALAEGDLDIVGAGRPLTMAEQALGLTEVPLEREKVAIIVGPGNPFNGNLTFEQFAQIFRGEITDWAEVGGTPGPIRLVDRPEYSDTRQALSNYAVFAGRPFATGATADPVTDDTTATVVKTLGNDGIGYAVASQVADRDDVRIVPMHQTLPDDSRYPYSQPRGYVYNSQNPSPEALAFLALATTPPGQEVVEAGETPAENPVSIATAEPTPAEQDTALVPPNADVTGQSRFPWWLLGIPILGGLLWWLLRDKGTPAVAPVAAPVVAPAAVEPSRIILTPRNCRRAYAYWEVSNEHRASQRDRGGRDLRLRLFDVTDRDLERHPPGRIDQFAVTEDQMDLHLPIPVDNRDYRVELGYVTAEDHWLPLAQSDPVRVPVCLPGEGGAEDAEVISRLSEDIPRRGAAVAAGVALAGGAIAGGLIRQGREPVPAAASIPVAPAPSRIILTPRSPQKAYAYWEVPDAAKATAKAEGGIRHQLKIYDATDVDLDHQPPHSVLTYDVDDADQDRFVPIPRTNRDYVAEIGYETNGGDWLSLARSEPVRVAANLPDISLPVVGAALAGATVRLGALAREDEADSSGAVAPSPAATITLTPTHDAQAQASWEISPAAHRAAQAEGGQHYQLRVYDVTDDDINHAPAQGVDAYGLLRDDYSYAVTLPQPGHDYLAEVGYLTATGTWLRLARSEVVTRPDGGMPPAAGTAGVAAAMAAGVPRPGNAETEAETAPPVVAVPASAASATCTIQTLTLHSRHHAFRLNDGQMQYLQDQVATAYSLDPGSYLVRIKAGVFNYGDPSHPGEPVVLLWMYGGQVTNLKTGVLVNATWSTLNGYADTLSLDVDEPAQLRAFFIDTFPENNIGEVTLSVVRF